MSINWHVFLEPLIYIDQHLENALPLDACIPRAANSNLTSPASGPFSKLMIRSVDLDLPFKVARKADPSSSTASFLLNWSCLIDEMGT